MTAPGNTSVSGPSAGRRRVGPWRVQIVITPYPGEKFDPSRPFEISRQTGRYTERMRDVDGKVMTFATDSDARAAIDKATGAKTP